MGVRHQYHTSIPPSLLPPLVLMSLKDSGFGFVGHSNLPPWVKPSSTLLVLKVWATEADAPGSYFAVASPPRAAATRGVAPVWARSDCSLQIIDEKTKAEHVTLCPGSPRPMLWPFRHPHCPSIILASAQYAAGYSTSYEGTLTYSLSIFWPP